MGMELARGVYERDSRFCKERIPYLVFREARKAADMRQKGNKYTARVICLQDLCELQDTVLPVLFKGFMVRNQLNRKETGDLGECGQYKHSNLVQSEISESRFITSSVI